MKNFSNEISISSIIFSTAIFRTSLKILLAFVLVFAGNQKSFAALPVSDEIYLGYQLVQDWDIASAEKLSKQLLKKYPESGDAHFLQARIEFMKGNYDRSWNILRQVEDNFEQVKEFKSHVDATRRASKNFISRETEHFIFRFEEGPDEILIHYAEKALKASYQILGKIFYLHR